MTLQYIMVAPLAANPTMHVYWASLNAPDFDGVFSGYPLTDLILPAVIDYSLETQLIGTGNVIEGTLAGGDLAGNYPSPMVVGLQGRAVSGAAPVNNSPLIWDSTTNQWIPGPVSGGGSLLPPVSNQQYAALIENPAGTPVFQRLTQDMILPSFVVSLSGGAAVQVAQPVVTPAFTATYSQAPVTAVLTDSVGNPPQNVISTPNSFSSANSYVKNVFGDTVTFTLTSNNGIVTRAATTTYQWLQLSFYGPGVAGGNTDAFIHGLSNSYITGSRGTTFTTSAGASQYIYFACRAAYGTPTFTVGGFAGGFSLVSNSINVTNAYAFTEAYQLWVSDNSNLGSTTVTVQ